MPQNNTNNNKQQHPGQKKKKKGRAPAHQNKFAFKHNPKSKTTEKILSSPIYHVCQRCHDKLEWRKQYRKYKPRTQPGTCNGCKRRNVKAAYHTICESCTKTSDKAKELIQQAELDLKHKKEQQRGEDAKDTNEPKDNDSEKEEDEDEEYVSNLRACAICVKEIALPGPADENEDDVLAQAAGRIRLRELKTLERQMEREAKQAVKTKDNDDDDNNDEGSESDLGASDDEENDKDQDEDDPFLQAVGGADKLLTGEAYQKKLLEQQQQQSSSPAAAT